MRKTLYSTQKLFSYQLTYSEVVKRSEGHRLPAVSKKAKIRKVTITAKARMHKTLYSTQKCSLSTYKPLTINAPLSSSLEEALYKCSI